jgi:hypothetical protein
MFFLFVDMPVGKVGRGDAKWNYASVLATFMFWLAMKAIN